MKARLPVRLFASYVVVILVGAATAYLTVRLLAPPLFERRMSVMTGGGPGRRGMGPGQPGGPGSTHAAFVSAVNVALIVAVLASALAAGLVGAFVTRRLLLPLNAVRAATRRIAAGNYAAQVPLPDEPELAALAADVNTLATELADTEARRTRLLGDVAHEMRSPLTALDGYVEGLIDGVFAAEPEHLQAMAEDVHRLHRLADDLSALSRAEEQRIELDLADIDLVQLTGRIAQRLRPQFDDAHVALAVRAPRPVQARVDEDRIAQVLSNLLGNALLATPAGGAVTVSVQVIGNQATATVTDTGVGLSAADCDRVFERFYRVATDRPRSAGSGVGLTIARGLVRAHGGDLQARSAGPGRGATFILTLPRGATAGQHDDPAESDQPAGNATAG